MAKTLFICNGCCCGHEEKGNPRINNQLFATLVKDTDIAIERPYCLGPCHLANVVKVAIDNNEYWFRNVNSDKAVKAVVDFVKGEEITKEVKAILMV